MTSHFWGDNFEYFEDVAEAADFIASYCRRWGRFSCYGKEKYGVVRLEYVYMGSTSFHSLLFPGKLYIDIPMWLYMVDSRFSMYVTQPLFGGLLYKYQLFILKRAYKLAVKKWPHIKDEIMEEYGWETGDEEA